MPHPLTHLLWGYMISKNISKNNDQLIIGLAASIVLDVPYIFDLYSFHRTSAHNLLFPLIVSLLLLLYVREIRIFGVCMANMIFHLVLDTVFSNSPVKWFAPFYDLEIGVLSSYHIIEYIIIQAILTTIPVVYILYRFFKMKENPFHLVKYLIQRTFPGKRPAG